MLVSQAWKTWLITDVGDQWVRNSLNKIDPKQKKLKKVTCWMSINHYSSNYSELLQSSGSVSMESQCLRTIKAHEPFKTLIDLNLNFTTETFIGLQIQLTETQSSHSFPNHNKVWKQKLKVTLRYGILESQNRVTKSSYTISLRYTSSYQLKHFYRNSSFELLSRICKTFNFTFSCWFEDSTFI